MVNELKQVTVNSNHLTIERGIIRDIVRYISIAVIKVNMNLTIINSVT